MKLVKIVSVVLVVVVLAVAGGVFFLLGNIDALVKKMVESEGPRVTQTPVLLKAVDIDIGLDEAGGNLQQFSIANPDGFTTSSFMEATLINVDIDPVSAVKGDVIVIKDITIEGVKLNLEQRGLSTNVTTLLKNIRSFGGDGGAAKPAKGGEAEAKEVRLMVERLKFADSSVHFVTEKYGTLDLALPSFDLRALGDKQTGLTPAELGKEIIEPLLQKAKSQAEKALKSRAEEELKSKATDKLKEKLGDETVEKLEGLKGLFGK